MAGLKSKDQLRVEYERDQFQNLLVDKDTDPDLYNFIEDIKENGPRFYSYSEETLKYFEECINELRKNNGDNTTGQVV